VSADDVLKIATVALVLAHVGIAVWLRSQIRWVIGLNLLVSAGVVAYWLAWITSLPGMVPLVWAFVAFECAVLILSLTAIFVTIPKAALWTAFAINGAWSVAAAIFAFTFKMDMPV